VGCSRIGDGIREYPQILGRDTVLSMRRRERLAVIQQRGEHRLTLTADALKFAKIEAGNCAPRLSRSLLSSIQFARSPVRRSRDVSRNSNARFRSVCLQA
jgi:signal transduction histidine kinase